MFKKSEEYTVIFTNKDNINAIFNEFKDIDPTFLNGGAKLPEDLKKVGAKTIYVNGKNFAFVDIKKLSDARV